MRRLLVAVVICVGVMATPASARTKSCTRALDSADRISVLFREFTDAVSQHIATAPVDANIAEMGASYKALADKAGEIAPKIAAERKRYLRYSAACRN